MEIVDVESVVVVCVIVVNVAVVERREIRLKTI